MKVSATIRSHKAAKSAVTTLKTWEFHALELIGAFQQQLGKSPTVHTPRTAMAQWQQVLRQSPPPEKQEILLVATRNRRWVEWAIFSACYMANMGYRPAVLFSGQEICRLYGNGRRSFWAGVSELPYLRLYDLDSYLQETAVDPFYKAFAQRNAHMLAAYDMRIEEYECDQDCEEYNRQVAEAEEMLLQHAAAFQQFLREHPVTRIICPSGLIANTRAYYAVTQQLGVDTIFVEGWSMRPGHNVWNLNRPALEYDIQGWLEVMGEWDETKQQEAMDYMRFREGKKVDNSAWLTNFHQVQRSHKEAQLPTALTQFLHRDGVFFLLGTNVIGDSATLGRATIFRSQRDWIQQIITYFQERPWLNLIIRVHPDEYVNQAKQKLGEIAAAAAGQTPNIYIIHGHEDVNTYALVDRIDIGLAWVSNIGLDMAIRGKPVVLAAAAQYSGLGLCQEPETEAEYFSTLESIAQNLTSPPEYAIWRGQAYHYIVFKMMSLLADSPNYDTADYRLNDPDEHSDRSLFYKTLAGELTDKGQSLP